MSTGPLFGNEASKGDAASGSIYVLRSKSDHPDVAAKRRVWGSAGQAQQSISQVWF